MFLEDNIKSSCIGMKYFGSPHRIPHSRKGRKVDNIAK